MRLSRNLFTAALFFLVPGCATPPPPDDAGLNSLSEGAPPKSFGHPTPPVPALPPTITPTTYVTIPVDAADAEPPVLAWLRWQKVRVETDTDGDARVYDSAAARHALVQYRRMLRLKLDTIAQNVANINTTRDARGELNPYRRKIVSIDDKGNIEIKTDPSPPREVYDPSNPEADSKGIVKYPNVDLTIEYVNARAVSSEFEQVVGMLQHLDPTRTTAGEVSSLPPRPEAAHSIEPQITTLSR